MDQQNIDRLFREKLDQMEVTPSNNSWSQVEKQIRPKKSPIVYWVAASVSLLFISWIVWPDATQPELTPIASEVTYPQQQGTPEFVIPEIEEAQKKEEAEEVKIAPRRVQSNVQTQLAVNKQESQKPKLVKEEMPKLEEMESKTLVAEAEVSQPEIPEEVKAEAEKPALNTVKITYIASSTNKVAAEEMQKNDTTGVLKKFIAFTEKIDPGDMLADIKTAKDNLLNGGFKGKKDRNSNSL